MTDWKPLESMTPDVARRECGGWLATAPKWSPLKFGVTAATEDAAREAFRVSLWQWLTALDMQPDPPKPE